MATLKREVKIEWKINPSYFTLANTKVITMPIKRIGSARPSVNRMLTKDEMMRALMPSIIGIDPSSQSSNWTKEVNDYWHSLSVEVPESGLTLDTSVKFDISDGHPIRSKYIAAFLEKHKDIKTSEELMDALTHPDSKQKISEDEMYRYAEPISITNYLLWYYCQGHRPIANNLDSINKSSKIEFYMFDANAKKEVKRKKTEVMIEATKEYVKVSSDLSKMRNILFVLSPDNARETIKLADSDVTIELHQALTSKPDQFVKVASDKNLDIRASIEKYIAANILKRIPETKTIVDATDQTKVLGHTTEEAIVYLTSDNPDVKKYYSELGIKFKSTTK